MQELLAESEGIHLEIEEIDLEDKETLALFASGNTKGIFQFEQPGAIRLLKRVQPVCFEDVVATTSLNRPGASDYINNFCGKKAWAGRSDCSRSSSGGYFGSNLWHYALSGAGYAGCSAFCWI